MLRLDLGIPEVGSQRAICDHAGGLEDHAADRETCVIPAMLGHVGTTDFEAHSILAIRVDRRAQQPVAEEGTMVELRGQHLPYRIMARQERGPVDL